MIASFLIVLGFLTLAHAFEICSNNGTICVCAPVKDISGWLEAYEIGTVVFVTILAALACFGVSYVIVIVVRRQRRIVSKVQLAA
jgi:hypothetical protein